MQDLYCSRKGNGTLQIELDSLKADNERLLELLKGTCEYADMETGEIIKAANNLKTKKLSAVGSSSRLSNTNRSKATSAAGGKGQKNNDWIPTEAVRAILNIKEKF